VCDEYRSLLARINAKLEKERKEYKVAKDNDNETGVKQANMVVGGKQVNVVVGWENKSSVRGVEMEVGGMVTGESNQVGELVEKNGLNVDKTVDLTGENNEPSMKVPAELGYYELMQSEEVQKLILEELKEVPALSIVRNSRSCTFANFASHVYRDI